jgi:hypothetical protein
VAALAVMAAAGCVALAGCGHTAALLSLRVGASERAFPVPRSFLGLSSDWNVVFTRTGYPAAGANPLYDQLIANLERYGGGPPTLRVGGNFQDMAFWDPSARVTAPDQARGLTVPITQALLEGLAVNSRITGQRMILGLNLAANDPALAATEVREILRYIPRRDVLALSIGNEPDSYSHEVVVHTAQTMRTARGPGYSAAQYLHEWGAVAAAVERVGHGVPLAANDSYDLLLSAAAFLARERGRIALFTQHHYVASACSPTGVPYAPRSPQYTTLAKLLASNDVQAQLPAVSAAARYRVPIQIDEMNSLSCGGRAALGDSFAAALWALNEFLDDALIGIHGIDLHGDSPDETPFAFGYNPATHRWQGYVGPLYYAMLAFAEAVGADGSLLPQPTLTASHAPGSDARAYVVREAGGGLHVVAVNLSLTRGGPVRVTVPGATAEGSLMRLESSTVGLPSHLSFAGQTIDTRTGGGRLIGRPRIEPVRPSGSVYEFELPPASAATLIVPSPAR